MDKQSELVDALLTLSRSALKVSKLLSESMVELNNGTKIALCDSPPPNDLSVDLDIYSDWPYIESEDIGLNHRIDSILSADPDKAILEYHTGPIPPITKNYKSHLLISELDNTFDYIDQRQAKLLSSFDDANNYYDIGVIYDCIELMPDPTFILKMLKQRCRKLYVRFRPWSGRSGGFLRDGKAYAHLVSKKDITPVHFKVVRPLSVYESLLKKCNLTITERYIGTHYPEEFFSEHPEILDVIITKTWDTGVDRNSALKIMATNYVEYVVC